MPVFRLENTEKAKMLFEGWQETIIWSCLQNVMGTVYGDDSREPQSAAAYLGDFVFFAGVPTRELVIYMTENDPSRPLILVPRTEEWGRLILNCCGERARSITRYAIKKEEGIFDRSRLVSAVESLNPEYTMKLIDEEAFAQCRESGWGGDLVSQFENYGEFRKLGLGVVALRAGELAAGAASYTRYREGIEIEVDTKEEHRRKGLAYACAARLILECLKRGLYPSWDAHNRASVGLAEKLGYHFSHEYTAFEV
ncbi:MAG: GNAT family N-acetyltransferase [Lachnospiraceae bacterium]|jgi:GNAT superfamily N-acetyltransferase|nr:GNAT family N-acetyltransferase [Lachnospiraceae bacterium]